jgi:hypothetical protein
MDELRKEIEEILKLNIIPEEWKELWGKGELETKCELISVAILSFFTQHQERVIERLEGEKRQAWLRSKAAGEKMPYSMNIGDRGWNKAIDKAIEIVREA